MNLKRLAANRGARFRLRPRATTVSVIGIGGPIDDVWLVGEVTQVSVSLVNERSGHSVSLSPDHVHGYTSSPPGSDFKGFLELKVTIDITSAEPVIDIIPSGAARMIPEDPPPMRARLESLLNRVSPEILAAARSNRGRVCVMVSSETLQRLSELRGEPGFDKLVTITSNGNVCMGLGNRIGGHIHEMDGLGPLHGLVLEFPDRGV